MIREVPEPQNPRLLVDLSPGWVPVLVERLQVLEDLCEALPPDAGRLIPSRGCFLTWRVMVLSAHRGPFSALDAHQASARRGHFTDCWD